MIWFLKKKKNPYFPTILSSITSNMDKNKAMDLNKAIERIWELKKMKGLNKEIRRRLMDNLFSTFSFELWCISHNKNVYIHRNFQ